MIYGFLRFSEKKICKKSANVISRAGLRRFSLKDSPQHKSRNICTKFHASTPIWSILLLTALTKTGSYEQNHSVVETALQKWLNLRLKELWLKLRYKNIEPNCGISKNCAFIFQTKTEVLKRYNSNYLLEILSNTGEPKILVKTHRQNSKKNDGS